jgi:anti-sigma-K factor RskA
MRRERQEDRDIAELVALADGSLDPERGAALREQVAASPELADRLAEQERAVSLARSAAAEVQAPPALRARIEAQRRSRGRVRAPRGFVLAGAAAAAVLVVAIGITVLQSGSSSQRFQAALGPTKLLPAASGKATLTKTASGWRIQLAAQGLPRLDKGRFYEAWLRNPSGVLVPVGTFNDGRKVTLWAGVSPLDFSTLTVTRERADGDQGSSGEKVLVGPVDTGSN